MIENHAYLDTIALLVWGKNLAANLGRDPLCTSLQIPALCSIHCLLIWELFTVIRSAKAMTGGGFLTGVIMMVNIWSSRRLWSVSDTEKWKLSVTRWLSVSNTAEYLQRPKRRSEWMTYTITLGKMTASLFKNEARHNTIFQRNCWLVA